MSRHRKQGVASATFFHFTATTQMTPRSRGTCVVGSSGAAKIGVGFSRPIGGLETSTNQMAPVMPQRAWHKIWVARAGVVQGQHNLSISYSATSYSGQTHAAVRSISNRFLSACHARSSVTIIIAF